MQVALPGSAKCAQRPTTRKASVPCIVNNRAPPPREKKGKAWSHPARKAVLPAGKKGWGAGEDGGRAVTRWGGGHTVQHHNAQALRNTAYVDGVDGLRRMNENVRDRGVCGDALESPGALALGEPCVVSAKIWVNCTNRTYVSRPASASGFVPAVPTGRRGASLCARAPDGRRWRCACTSARGRGCCRTQTCACIGH